MLLTKVASSAFLCLVFLRLFFTFDRFFMQVRVAREALVTVLTAKRLESAVRNGVRLQLVRAVERFLASLNNKPIHGYSNDSA